MCYLTMIYGQVIQPLAGIVVIDVVEGSALAALPFMMGVLNQRPQSFGSVQEAIRWATSSGGNSPLTAHHLTYRSQMELHSCRVSIRIRAATVPWQHTAGRRMTPALLSTPGGR